MKLILATADAQVLRRWRNAVQGLGSLVVVAPLQELKRTLDRSPPDVCLVDVLLAAEGRPAFFLRLFADYANVRFMLMTDRPEVEEGWKAIKNGARGYCNRYMAPDLLRKVVELVMAGEIWVGRTLLSRLMAQYPSAVSQPAEVRSSDPFASLTQREHQIAGLVSEGANNKRIAQRLGITERTVKAHLSAIFRKTGAVDRLKLALLYRDATAGHSTNVQ